MKHELSEVKRELVDVKHELVEIKQMMSKLLSRDLLGSHVQRPIDTSTDDENEILDGANTAVV